MTPDAKGSEKQLFHASKWRRWQLCGAWLAWGCFALFWVVVLLAEGGKGAISWCWLLLSVTACLFCYALWLSYRRPLLVTQGSGLVIGGGFGKPLEIPWSEILALEVQKRLLGRRLYLRFRKPAGRIGFRILGAKEIEGWEELIDELAQRAPAVKRLAGDPD